MSRDKDAMLRVLSAVRAFGEKLPQMSEEALFMIGADVFKGCTSLTNVEFKDKTNWSLVNYSTQTYTPVGEEAFASGEALATYLKENLTAGYVLTNGAVAA